MEKYKVKIEQIAIKEVIISAKSEADAVKIVEQKLSDKEILVTDEDVEKVYVEVRDILSDYDISNF